MSDNQGNPLQGSETDLQKATKAVDGLLNPKEEEVIGQQEPPKEEIKQNSPEPQQEESEEEQPLEQEIKEEETEADLNKMLVAESTKDFRDAQQSQQNLEQQIESLNERPGTGKAPTGSKPIQQG